MFLMGLTGMIQFEEMYISLFLFATSNVCLFPFVPVSFIPSKPSPPSPPAMRPFSIHFC